MVLTGGYRTSMAATEVSGLEGEEVAVRELSSLLQRRYHHACGSYRVGEVQVLLPPSTLHGADAGGGGRAVRPGARLLRGGHRALFHILLHLGLLPLRLLLILSSSSKVLDYRGVLGPSRWREAGDLPSPR